MIGTAALWPKVMRIVDKANNNTVGSCLAGSTKLNLMALTITLRTFKTAPHTRVGIVRWIRGHSQAIVSQRIFIALANPYDTA